MSKEHSGISGLAEVGAGTAYDLGIGLPEIRQVDIDATIEALPPEIMTCHGQLSQDDRLIYYWCARHYFSGAGTIIDAGVLVGGTTTIISEGLLGNPAAKKVEPPLVHVYDLFTDDRDGYSAQFIKGLYNDASNRESIYDFEPHFRRNTKKYQSMLTVHKGDITKFGYKDPRPIEILSIDVAKTPALMHAIALDFFPHLIPGKSLVLHQDYIFAFQPWLLIAMELMGDLFKKVYDCPQQVTSVFVPRRAISREDVIARLGETADGYYNLSNAIYIEKAAANATTPLARLHIKAALAYFYLVKGKIDTARYVARRIIDEEHVSKSYIERTELKLLLQGELGIDYAPLCS